MAKRVLECQCCELPYLTQTVPSHDAGEHRKGFCDECFGHQGDNDQISATRHRHHADKRKIWIDKARAAAQDAIDQRDEARDRMKKAFDSRTYGVRYLQRLADLHQLDPELKCKCGKHPCPEAEILGEDWPQRMIQRLDFDDEQDEIEREIESEYDRRRYGLKQSPDHHRGATA